MIYFNENRTKDARIQVEQNRIKAAQNAVEAKANQAILARLKSPATALITWTKKGNDKWTGYVDSQNGFGALLRSDISITFIGGDVVDADIVQR